MRTQASIDRHVSFLKLLLVSISLLSTLNVRSQDSINYPAIKKNILYLELLGNAGFYSLNYERIITSLNHHKSYITARVGFSYQSYAKDSTYSYQIPIEVNAFFGTGDNHFEMGIGYIPYKYQSNIGKPVDPNLKNYYVLSLRAGYRFQILNNNENRKVQPFGRVGLLGFEFKDVKDKAWKTLPWFSACIGFSFGSGKTTDNSFYYN